MIPVLTQILKKGEPSAPVLRKKEKRVIIFKYFQSASRPNSACIATTSYQLFTLLFP